MRKNLITKGIFLVLFLGITLQTFGQKFKTVEKQSMSSVDITITGSREVNINSTKTYYANAQGVEIYEGNWDVKGATIISQNRTSATIRWNEAGNKVIGYIANTNRGKSETSYSVTVNATDAPATPAIPEISSQTCNSAVLKSTGTPPNGVTWYWQGGNPNGTRMTHTSESNFTALNSGRFYLRARNSSGVWSSSSSSVYVTLGTIGGITWYADTDGDGLGDPNTTLVQCVQPNGYVSNSDDLCPEANGTGNPNGCPVDANDAIYENYVYTIIPQKATTSVASLTSDRDKIENITYFDGIGRARQSIGIKQSPNRKDIVTHIEYDGFGRQIQEFLPYASNTNDKAFKANALSKTKEYYKTHYPDDFEGVAEANINPYSEKALELSPLNRVVEQTAPGSDWEINTTKVQGRNYSTAHSIKLEYDTNIVNEVKKYSASTVFRNRIYKPTLIDEGNYPASELLKSVTKDENWTEGQQYIKDNTTEEFKNKEGQVILKRKYNNNQKHDTYFVYDDFGNLTYVFPPKSEAGIDKPNPTELSELCYQYKYDDRNRLVEKKIPGKGWDFIVYDNLDRPVLTQDANGGSRSMNKWLFTKYDIFGRVIYTGIYPSNSSRDALQTTFTGKNASQNYENKESSTGTLGIYYSNRDFPSVGLEVLTVNYYDNYTFNRAGSGVSVNAFGVPSTTNVKGLATGSKVKVLETNNWITTVSYYDDKARPIYIYSNNEYLKATDIVKTKLDFTGKTVQTESSHTKSDDNISETIKTTDNFKYDHTGRLLEQTQYGTAREGKEVIVSNVYDELGQLKTKSVGGKTTQKRLQDIDYKYNVRGWLTHINDVGNSNATVDLNNKDLFGFEINYNKPSSGSGLYNGNVSQTLWKTKSINASSNPVSNAYTYNYDAMNRITKATDNTGNYNLNAVNYDKNGNILTLSRNGHLNEGATSFGVMDNLVYTYDSGNKLMKVLDNGNDNFGFKDGSNLSTEYDYDKNGNMVRDANKGIGNITYNHLNLPVNVSFYPSQYASISYVYDATGAKLKKTVSGYGTQTTITEYANGYIYKKTGDSDKELQFFPHPEGYIKNDGGKFGYVYEYKDHLQNVRLSYTDANNDGEITISENPNANEIIEEKNYMPFGGLQRGYNSLKRFDIGNSSAQSFGFGGKELNQELGLEWHDFDARNYDASLGRWMNLDPLAEQYYEWSPYNYSYNSPIIFTDPTGLGPIYDADGNVIGYEVEEGQGPTQIAEDLNSLGIYNSDVSFLDIVNLNGGKFTNVKNKADKNNAEYRVLNMNPGDKLKVPGTPKKEEAPSEATTVAEGKMVVPKTVVGDVTTTRTVVVNPSPHPNASSSNTFIEKTGVEVWQDTLHVDIGSLPEVVSKNVHDISSSGTFGGAITREISTKTFNYYKPGFFEKSLNFGNAIFDALDGHKTHEVNKVKVHKDTSSYKGTTLKKYIKN